MVSIDPDRVIVNIAGDGKDNIRANGKQHGFKEIYRKKTTSVSETDGEMKPTNFVSNLRPPQFSNEASPPTTDMVVDQVQRLIDTMECYQQKLMEKKVTLKDIHPLIQKMTTESESLSTVSKKLSATDSLRSIVNQSLILSSVEIVKYNSGFYNAG